MPALTVDYKQLLTQVQKSIATLPIGSDTLAAISLFANTINHDLGKQLGISGGRLYQCRPDGSFELIERFGESSTDGELGISVPKEYRPVELVLENGIVVMDPHDPGIDPELESRLGARRFAAIAVGDENFILSFGVSPEASREDLLFSLNMIRYVINQRILTQRYGSLIEEAQKIQKSILPQRVPNYAGFDIFGRTVPAESVSGDFYDFIPISDSILGLAVADGSGHGLPAALVVRDIYMGLRMGADRDFKIIKTIQKLNNIIHRSRMTTKFVSLFYGELELTGTFIYTNAGHPAPFLLKKNSVEMLTHGGMVLGPTPDATYQRGYVKVEPGDVLCLYSDGIIEAHDRKDQEFGLERLMRIVKASRDKPAQEITNEVLQKVERFGRVGEDDRTVVIVKGIGTS